MILNLTGILSGIETTIPNAKKMSNLFCFRLLVRSHLLIDCEKNALQNSVVFIKLYKAH